MANTISCSDCGSAILDRYALQVDGKLCHETCVRCSECSCLLSTRCFTRDGSIFCLNDFSKLFGSKCQHCAKPLFASDLVHKVKVKETTVAFHANCFACSTCGVALSHGANFCFTEDSMLLCADDCGTSAENEGFSVDMGCKDLLPPEGDDSPKHSEKISDEISALTTDSRSNIKTEIECDNMSPFEWLAPDVNEDVIKSDSTDDNLSSNDSVTVQSSQNQKKRGPRTTIKPEQLETLMGTFRKSSKPPRQVRENLSAETGLSMRVIQVWFQNRRSKVRRMNQATGVATADHFVARHTQRRHRELTTARQPERLIHNMNSTYFADRHCYSSPFNVGIFSSQSRQPQSSFEHFNPMQVNVHQQAGWTPSNTSNVALAPLTTTQCGSFAGSNDSAVQSAFNGVIPLPATVSDLYGLEECQSQQFNTPVIKQDLAYWN